VEKSLDFLFLSKQKSIMLKDFSYRRNDVKEKKLKVIGNDKEGP
jgi:hypothetical protein